MLGIQRTFSPKARKRPLALQKPTACVGTLRSFDTTGRPFREMPLAVLFLVRLFGPGGQLIFLSGSPSWGGRRECSFWLIVKFINFPCLFVFFTRSKLCTCNTRLPNTRTLFQEIPGRCPLNKRTNYIHLVCFLSSTGCLWFHYQLGRLKT